MPFSSRLSMDLMGQAVAKTRKPRACEIMTNSTSRTAIVIDGVVGQEESINIAERIVFNA
ncbi:hypothetical protein BDV12DRAFT_180823 [Aspergillus spectabilis]